MKISTTHNNVSFEAEEIDALIDQVQSSRGYDDRVPWKSLTVKGRKLTGRSPVFERYIRLEVHDDIRITVSGSDHIWVHGQLARIQLFLANRNGQEQERLFPPSKPKVEFVAGLCLLLWFYVFAAASISGRADPSSESAKLWRDASLWVLIPVVITQTWSFLFKLTKKAAAKGKISFTSDVATGSIWQRMDWQTRILFITLIVAALAAVGTLVSAGADVLKP